MSTIAEPMTLRVEVEVKLAVGGVVLDGVGRYLARVDGDVGDKRAVMRATTNEAGANPGFDTPLS